MKPSVLHGDLWSGNIAAVDGKPCIFDPAVYYGHHEAEWGMSWHAAPRQAAPLPASPKVGRASGSVTGRALAVKRSDPRCITVGSSLL